MACQLNIYLGPTEDDRSQAFRNQPDPGARRAVRAGIGQNPPIRPCHFRSTIARPVFRGAQSLRRIPRRGKFQSILPLFKETAMKTSLILKSLALAASLFSLWFAPMVSWFLGTVFTAVGIGVAVYRRRMPEALP